MLLLGLGTLHPILQLQRLRLLGVCLLRAGRLRAHRRLGRRWPGLLRGRRMLLLGCVRHWLQLLVGLKEQRAL